MNKELAMAVILSSLGSTGLNMSCKGNILVNSGYTKSQFEAIERKRISKLKKTAKTERGGK